MKKHKKVTQNVNRVSVMNNIQISNIYINGANQEWPRDKNDIYIIFVFEDETYTEWLNSKGLVNRTDSNLKVGTDIDNSICEIIHDILDEFIKTKGNPQDIYEQFHRPWKGGGL